MYQMHLYQALHKKMKFSIKDFFDKFLQETADLVLFTEEILNGQVHFLCSETHWDHITFQSRWGKFGQQNYHSSFFMTQNNCLDFSVLIMKLNGLLHIHF